MQVIDRISLKKILESTKFMCGTLLSVTKVVAEKILVCDVDNGVMKDQSALLLFE
jgi:hypothetical protein